MYKICVGKNSSEHVIFDPNRAAGVSDSVYVLQDDIEWDEEVDAAGSLSFTIPYNHPALNYVVNHKPFIYIYRSGNEIWRGRVTTIDIDGAELDKKITAEGDLAFLYDSIQRPYTLEDTTIRNAFSQMIAEHNAQVESSKEFIMGVVDNEDEEIDVENTSYQSTLQLMQTVFVENEGMHIRTRKGPDNTYYLDLLAEGYGTACNQKIQLGKNIVDISVSEETEELYTCLIPLGKSSSTSAISGGGSTELVTYARSQIGSYGSDNNKFSQAVAGGSCQWCHCFVSYCAQKVGLSSSKVPWTASTTEGMAQYKAWNRFHYKGSFTPSPGDIVYFKNGESHVAIVSGYTGSSITIIEGNTSSDSVAERTISSGTHWWNAITGYGTYGSTASSTTEYAGTKHNAKFYCYSPGEGGYQDASGNSLSAYLQKGQYVCAAPSDIPLGTKIQIHVTSGNSSFNGRVYTVRDRGDSHITVGSDGTYGIDLLVASKSEQWSGSGTITVLDNSVGGDGETESEEAAINIRDYRSFEHEVSNGTIVHKKGKDYIYHKEAVQRYGRIFGAKQWSKTVSRKKLIKKAEKYLKRHAAVRRVVEFKVIDLAETGAMDDPITIGCKAQCYAGAYGVDGLYDCKSIKHIINEPARSEYTFSNKKRNLSDYSIASSAINVATDDSGSSYDYSFDT